MARLTPSPWVSYKPPKVTPKRINNAIAWLTQNRQAISACLPVKTDRYNFDQVWLNACFNNLIPLWINGCGNGLNPRIITIQKPALGFAVMYLFEPIGALHKAIGKQIDSPAPTKPLIMPYVRYAVTLHRPWTYAIAHLGKDIENRGFRPAALKKGEWLAIHAGKKFDKKAVLWIADRELGEVPEDNPQDHPTGVVALAQLGDVVDNAIDGGRWFVGPVGWKLENLIVLPQVIDCPGQQRLWALPQWVRDEIRSMGQEAIAA